MKTTIKLLSILIIGMGVAGTSFANSPFSSGENFGGTVFDPLGSRQCFYEFYCDRTTGVINLLYIPDNPERWYQDYPRPRIQY